MAAKTGSDRAHDAILKAVSSLDVNWYHVAHRLQQSRQRYVRDKIWDFIVAYIKCWEIESRHPLPDRTPEDLIFADKMARIHKHL